MVYRHTNFNPLTWWRPMAMTLGLLVLIGSFGEVKAQQACDILVSSPDTEVQAPDGTTVDLIYVDLDLDNVANNGLAEITRTLFAGTPTSPGRITSSNYVATPGNSTPCNIVFIYDAQGNPIDFDVDADGTRDDVDGTAGLQSLNNSPLQFDCKDRDGGPTPKRGTRFFIKIDDDTDPNVDDNNLTDFPNGDDDLISSYAAIEIRSIEDNHPPIIEVPLGDTVFCEYSTDPYVFYDTGDDDLHPSLDSIMDGMDDNFLGIVDSTAYVDRLDDNGMRYDGRVLDNCTSFKDMKSTVRYRDELDFSATATAPDGHRIFNRIWMATDQSGNIGRDTQIVTVIDRAFPVFEDPDGNGPIMVTPVSGTDSTDIEEYVYTDFPDTLTCTDNFPVFNPTTHDNCDLVVDVTSGDQFFHLVGTTPTATTLNGVNVRNFTNLNMLGLDDYRRYDFNIIRTYTAVDDFGKTSTATRRFEYRDRVPPVFSTVHNSLGTPVFLRTLSRTESARVAANDDLKRKDLYMVADTVLLSPSSPNAASGPCTSTITMNPRSIDDCSNTRIRYSYEVYETSPTNSAGTFFSSRDLDLLSNFDIDGLRSGTTYRIRINAQDIVGNISCVDVMAKVRPTVPLIGCGSILQIPFDPNNGQTFVTAQQILGTVPEQPCNYNQLTFEVQDLADGLVLPSGRTTGVGNSSQLTSAAANASVTFDCTDVGSDREVQVTVKNNNGGEISCTRIVRLISNGNSAISSAATTSGASTTTAADGSITVTTSGDSGPFTYTVTGPTNRTVTGGSPFTITNLRSGNYTVNIATGNGCSTTTVSNLYVPVNDPIELYTTCPQVTTNGTVDIPILVRGFNNMNSTEFTVTLTGGLTITSATAVNLPQTTSVNIVSGTSNKVTFSWFVQNMNTTPSINLSDGTAILNIRAQAPSTTGSYSVLIDGSVTAISATQNQGAGAAASTSVPVNFTNPLCNGSIINSPASISGNINFFSPTGSGVNDVTLTLNTNGTVTTSTSTATGGYSEQVTPNGNVTLTPSRPHTNQTQLLDGVNGGDLVQIQRNILGLSNTLSGNAYKTIAADANGNNTVDGGDLVRIQRAILGLESSFAVPAWRFIRASQTFSNPNSPFAGLQENYTNASLNSAVTVNFIGIKIGDVDCSASYPYKLTSEGGSEKATNTGIDYRGVLPIQVKEQKLKAGELYEVKFTAQDFRDLLTYQTTIEFNTDALTFVDVTTNDALANLSEASFSLQRAAEGMITTLWYNAIEQSLADGTEVFTLRFRANEENILSRVLRFTSNGIPQMAMGTDYETFNIDLNFENAIKPADKFDLNQNRPNPFGDETVITFELTEGSVATIAITDINGRVVRTYQQNFTPGYHEIKVNRADVPSAGVYFYQLTTPTQQSAIRKMIVVD